MKDAGGAERRAAARAGTSMAVLIALMAGCSSPPAPHGPRAPAPIASAAPVDAIAPTEVGASDTVSAAPGSADAKFAYRFHQTLPGSDHFTFFDRDLSFYFRPAPDALHFQIENKQDRVVWIDWDRTRVLSPDGAMSKAAHASTTFQDRFNNTQTPFQLRGLQRYSDYVLPMDYLIDPGTSTQQVHRPMFPEDETAPNYSGREFGVDLATRVDNQPRTYSFRFKVVSVLPR